MDTDELIFLTQTYEDLQPKNSFEVVFVGVNDSFNSEMSEFVNIISRMPWTTIPLSDITSRKHLQRLFDIPEKIYFGIPIIVDSTGMILQFDPLDIFEEYGALGYPFSDERIDYVNSEVEAASKQPSLKTLLASPERDYLISNRGDKVPIHTLEDKVVALYFYEEGLTSENVTQELEMAYQQLAKNNRKFEVVLIYLDPRVDDFKMEESFWKIFKTMPWMAVPFNDSISKKLELIFEDPWGIEREYYSLTIIGPRMEFIEPYGVFVLQTFKVSAYPFSCEKAARLVTEEAKELKLEMLWDPNSVFGGNNESQVQFSQFAGKKVIIFFHQRELNSWELGLLESLKERYIQMRGTNYEFEVIHITKLSSKHLQVANLPWFVQPLGKDYISRVSVFFGLERYYENIYPTGRPLLIAFDQNGIIVRKTKWPTLETKEFPFYAGGMEKETLSQLEQLYWNCPMGKIFWYNYKY